MPDERVVGGSGPPVPQGPLDRAALDRVLARAAELQAHEHDPADATLTEEQIVEVGREVGLAPEHVRQALAEERMRVEIAAGSGRMDRVFGGAVARASRAIRGDARQVLGQLDRWMREVECLQVKRAYGERIVWEKRGGFVSELRRGLNVGGRGYHLAKAREVSATAIAVDQERVLVRLEAELTNVRTEYIAGGAGLATGGAAIAGGLLVLGVIPIVAVVPVVLGLGGGYAVSRGYAGAVERAQLALEQVLDGLERGDEPKASLLASISESIKIIRI